jgi:ElaB/YqjD/DUF883 family membrane-anchored ribosome-binding protein
METNTSFKSATFAEKIGRGLKIAQQEIEELALQFALGKAEAADKFEEIKKDFNTKANNWKKLLEDSETFRKEKASALKAKFEALQVQLALGKAEAKDLFEEQYKKILHAIHEMEAEMKGNPGMRERLDEIKSEMEKFKLKMEILKLKYELKKFDVKDDFKDAMTDARIKIGKLSAKTEEKWEDTKKKYSEVGEEIDEAFKHIRKAVDKL